MTPYAAFLDAKTQAHSDSGFEPVWVPEFLFDFQAALVEWAVRKGRAAIFADCGLGKTPMQLVWAENVARWTNRRVLIVTPLAVAWQTIEEAAKFGVEASYSKDGRLPSSGLVVTNYERLHLFDSADFAGLVFRRSGENPIPVAHPSGLTEYAGERPMPVELLPYRNWQGNQIENRWSHWIWRQYASAFWDDVRLDRVLPFRAARDEEDEKHVHPLQLDVIDRALVLWSNPGETVLTPFMGVGSEVYAAVRSGRLGVGVELKRSYYLQAVKNMRYAVHGDVAEESWLESVEVTA